MLKSLLKTAIVALLCLFGINTFAQQFTLTGTLSGAPAVAKVFINYTNTKGVSQRDSAVVTAGKFKLTGDVNQPHMAFLTFYEPGSKALKGNTSFFVEPANITATGDYANIKTMKFSGSVTQAEYEVFQKEMLAYNAKMQPQQDKYTAMNLEYARLKKANPDDNKLARMAESLDSIREILNGGSQKIVRAYVDTHKTNYVTAYFLMVYQSSWPLPYVKSLYAGFPAGMQGSVYLKTVKNYLEDLEASSVGHLAKNFTKVDINGKTISLSDFKGKYVVMDFWASWCVPCRQSSPHLLAMYNKYHSKGMEVIAISDDDSALDAWKRAIKQDGIGMWNHILRGMDRNNRNSLQDLDNVYAVHEIPTKLLIDKNGVIIGRYLDVTEDALLEKKLDEVFK